jgi:PAS domain S-box-containing protein
VIDTNASRRHSWLLATLLSAAFLAMTVTVGLYYFRQRRAMEAAAASELSAIASVETIQIANWRRERLGDGRLLASFPEIRAAGSRLSGVATPAERARLRSVMATLRLQFRYDDVSLVDAGGNVLLRLQDTSRPSPGDQARIQKARRAELARQAHDAGDVTLSDIGTDNRARTRLMTLTVPLDQEAALILEIEPTTFLFPYLLARPGTSRTGETVLVRLDGDEIVMLSELRHLAASPELRRKSVKHLDVSEAQLAQGVLLRETDYRGAQVLAHARRVPDSPWILVAKIDAAEVYAPLTRLAWEMGAIMALIAIASGAGVALIWKRHQLRMLNESEERFRSIANDTPSFLWMVSAGGDKVFVNKRLSDLVGASDAESPVQWEEYLHPEDAARVEAQFLECFAHRANYSDEVRIRRADGRYRWVLGQGVPRLSPQGEFLGFAGALLDITARKEAEAQLKSANAVLAGGLADKTRKEAEIRALSARLINAQEEERKRLSRELHDDLSQQIAALSIGMGNMKRGIPAEQAASRAHSDRIQQKLIDLSESVRRMSHELHPAVLHHSGLAPALHGYCREFEELSGIHIALETSGTFGDLRPDVALCVFRVTQEALRNVSKHARVAEAQVELAHAGRDIRLTVSDRGVGFAPGDAPREAGLGLVSIRERARLVDGTVELESAPGEGTRLTIRIPDAREESPANL